MACLSLLGTASGRDTQTMSCRHQRDAPAPGSLAATPSACRKWRRFPRELPRPANNNNVPTAAWTLRTIRGALPFLTTLLGLAAVFSS